jgi:hypothetical protein
MPKGTRVPDALEATIAAAYASGRASADVGREFGVSGAAVLAIARRAGQSIRPARKYRAVRGAALHALVADYPTLTISQIALKHGVCEATVCKVLAESGRAMGVAASNARRRGDPEDQFLLAVFGVYVRTARKRGIDFNLELTDVANAVDRPCIYCGRIGVNCWRSKRKYNGIDRVDNTRGYTIDNVVTACADCNRAKSDMGLDQFKSWIARVYATYVKEGLP